jgi:hypothetical protein
VMLMCEVLQNETSRIITAACKVFGNVQNWKLQ